MNKDTKIPLLWTSLSNKYGTALQFANIHDPKGLTAKSIIGGKKSKKSKVLVFAEGSVEPSLYEGAFTLIWIVWEGILMRIGY